MDSITQAALGAAVGGAVLGKRLGRKAIVIGALLVLYPIWMWRWIMATPLPTSPSTVASAIPCSY